MGLKVLAVVAFKEDDVLQRRMLNSKWMGFEKHYI